MEARPLKHRLGHLGAVPRTSLFPEVDVGIGIEEPPTIFVPLGADADRGFSVSPTEQPSHGTNIPSFGRAA